MTRLLALFVALGLVVGCAGPPPPPSDTLTVGVSRDLVEGPRDPYFVHASLRVWESLVELGEDLEPRPLLAESWSSSADARSWSFQIRPNVKFHDGSPLDAAAVAANVERFLKISPRPSPFFLLDKSLAYGSLRSVEVSGPLTVQFRLDEPTPMLPSMMAGFFSAIFAPSSFDANGDFAKLVATGPFQLGEWKKGEGATLERFDGYWRDRARLKTVRIKVLPDPPARLAALRAGEVQAVAELGAILPDQAAEVAADSGLKLGRQPIALSHYLFFNGTRAPFSDARARQAISLLLDRRGLVSAVLSGHGTPAVSVLHPLSSRWTRTDLAPIHDPTRAASLMAAALSTGASAAAERRPVSLVLSAALLGRAPYKTVAEILQDRAASLGLDVQITVLDAAAYNAALKAGDYDIAMGSQGWPNGDPHYIFGRYLHSRGQLNVERRLGASDPATDELIDRAVREPSFELRKTVYDRLQELAADQVHLTPLWHDVALYAHRDGLTDLGMDVNYRMTLAEARWTR